MQPAAYHTDCWRQKSNKIVFRGYGREPFKHNLPRWRQLIILPAPLK